MFALSLFAICAVFASSGAAQSQPPEVPEANLGRPTVSTPATVGPVVYLQFETSLLDASHCTQPFLRSNAVGNLWASVT